MIKPIKGSMAMTYKNRVWATPSRYMQVSRDKIEGLQLPLKSRAYFSNSFTNSCTIWQFFFFMETKFGLDVTFGKPKGMNQKKHRGKQ